MNHVVSLAFHRRGAACERRGPWRDSSRGEWQHSRGPPTENRWADRAAERSEVGVCPKGSRDHRERRLRHLKVVPFLRSQVRAGVHHPGDTTDGGDTKYGHDRAPVGISPAGQQQRASIRRRRSDDHPDDESARLRESLNEVVHVGFSLRTGTRTIARFHSPLTSSLPGPGRGSCVTHIHDNTQGRMQHPNRASKTR